MNTYRNLKYAFWVHPSTYQAYKNQEKAAVVLVEGSVNVKDQQNHHIKMVPNEKVELKSRRYIRKRKSKCP